MSIQYHTEVVAVSGVTLFGLRNQFGHFWNSTLGKWTSKTGRIAMWHTKRDAAEYAGKQGFYCCK